MRAIILSIGDELVLGQTVDTNSAWLSQQLAAVGVAIEGHATVSDDQAAIERAIRDALPRCDVLIISGGIGPTPDDLTRQALAAVMNEPLEMSAQWLSTLQKFFTDRGRVMPEINRIQAMIPRTARMIDNTAGTAAGIDAVVRHAAGTCRVFVMPGVPKEMKTMFQRDVLSHLRGGGAGAILSRTLHTFGLGESAVAERLGDLMKRDRNPSVGTTVSGGVVSLRVNSRFTNVDQAQEQLERTAQECRAALGDLIYGCDEQTLPGVVADLLASSPDDLDVTTAETGTGGLLSAMLTEHPAVARYCKRGWIAAAPQAIGELLGVPPELLAEKGWVSEAVALEMARVARGRARSDFALAIAGPDESAPADRAGIACIALEDSAGSQVRTFNLFGDRSMIRDRAAKMALTVLRFRLMGRKLPF